MDRGLSLIAAALLAGCGLGAPDFTTELGVEVHLQGHRQFLDKRQADEMERWLLEAAPAAGYPERAIRCCLSKAQVRVVGDSYSCYGGRACAGEQWDETLVVVDTGCAWSSAYIHEMAHWLQQCVLDRYDPEHEEQPLWDIVRSQPSCCPAP
jgi:hypothetical protein